MARGLARYFRGILDEAAATEHPERLERRSKAMARIGRLIPGRCSRGRWPRRALSPQRSAAVGRRRSCSYADADVAAARGRRLRGPGALWTFNGVSRFVPHLGIWNMTGQPAASVPAGLTPRGRCRWRARSSRASDEATLMSLSAQIEARAALGRPPPPVASSLLEVGARRRRPPPRCSCRASAASARRARSRRRPTWSPRPTSPPSGRSAPCSRARRPDDGVLGEEGTGDVAGTSGPALGRRPARRDGQLPLRHPQWCVSVAVEDETAAWPASCSTRCAASASPRPAARARRSTARRCAPPRA